MTEGREDELPTGTSADINDLLKLKVSEFKARRDAGLISPEQLKFFNKLLSQQICKIIHRAGIVPVTLDQDFEKGLRVVQESMEFYDTIDSKSASELLDLRDAACSDAARRLKARETGSQGGKAREGKRYSAKNHAYWKQLAAQRYPTINPRAAAIKVADYLQGALPPGDPPAMRTVYGILLKDQSWRGVAKPKDR